MYFSTWWADLKTCPYTIAPRCASWSGVPPKASIAGSVSTGAKIIAYPFIKSFLKGRGGVGHQSEMERFYDFQKKGYDAFREGLLHARSSLIDYIPLKKAGGMTWVDIGGGTARNLEYLPVEALLVGGV